MNIIDTIKTFNAARHLRATGDYLAAARKFYRAQQMAAQCRSAKRASVRDYAHAGATTMALAVMHSDDASHADKSEAGRIRAESIAMYSRG